MEPTELKLHIEILPFLNVALLRYMARMFGFAKVGGQIDALVRYAVDMAEQKGKRTGRPKWIE